MFDSVLIDINCWQYYREIFKTATLKLNITYRYFNIGSLIIIINPQRWKKNSDFINSTAFVLIYNILLIVLGIIRYHAVTKNAGVGKMAVIRMLFYRWGAK